MQTNPLNSIETTLGNLYGSDPLGIKNVAHKIRTGLGHEGFTVVKSAHVDRLLALLSAINPEDSDVLREALGIVEGWK